MDQFIDNLARELAKPTSRRGVIRLVGGAMLGSLVAAWMPASLEARTYTCPYKCRPGNPNGKTCCKTGSSPFCISSGKVCCGNSYCPNGYTCCGSGSCTSCASPSESCCGNNVCESNETCCGGKYCCGPNQQCKNGRCVASNC